MTVDFKGVNLAGMEFGPIEGHRLWWNYAFNGEEHYEYWAQDVGANIVRLPFTWERLQHDLNADLDPFYLDLLKQSVDFATQNGMTLILDMHNYGRYTENGVTRKIGEDGLTAAHLSDAWQKLGEHFKENDNVWLNLMNEPYGFQSQQWADITQEVVNDIRSEGIENKILLSGSHWSGAHGWDTNGNGDAYASFIDPSNNYAFDVHQYLDANFSGTTGTMVDGAGATRLIGATQWARENGHELFLGEFGASDNTIPGQENVDDEVGAMLNYMDNNSDVWLGWAAWGAGEWWRDDYHFNLNADNLDQENESHNSIVDYLLPHFDLEEGQQPVQQNENDPNTYDVTIFSERKVITRDNKEIEKQSKKGIDFEGTQNDDFINGSQNNDTIRGSKGNDVLKGNQGNDILYGDGGDDTIEGGLGADIIKGGWSGSDIIKVTQNSSITYVLDFEKNHDKIDISALGITSLNDFKANGIQDGSSTIFTLNGATLIFERAKLNDFNENNINFATEASGYIADINATMNVMIGAHRSQTMNGTDGDDFIFGELGDDVINGGLGNDILNGGYWGADTFIIDDNGSRDIIYNFEHDRDQIDLSAFEINNLEEALSFAEAIGSQTILFDFGQTSLIFEQTTIDNFVEENFIFSDHNIAG